MVKYVPDRTGRFFDRPHYEPKELDVLCEQMVRDFYKKQNRSLALPILTDDLTLMIEMDVSDFDGYADLERFGSDVQGVTEFLPGRKPRVRISAQLAEDERRENRYRTTLTHEYGHVRLHSYLFELARPQRTLDSASLENDRVQVCKRETMISAPKNDWMEWQAGHVCGAILMPLSAMSRLVGGFQRKRKLYGPVPAGSAHGQELIAAVVSECQVSSEAARVRLTRLGFLGAKRGAALF